MSKAFEKIKAGLEWAIADARGHRAPGTVVHTLTISDPPPAMSAADIRRLRKSLDMSQVVFASALNAAPQTVHAWEQGRTTPSGPALRLLQIVQENPSALHFGTAQSQNTAPMKPRRRNRQTSRR